MDSQKRIAQLVKELKLQPHPEGGFFTETYRSTEILETASGKRNLATVIYFLLTSENHSNFHRIKSDEHWFWHEGSTLSVHILGEKGHQILALGPVGESGCSPQQLVPANTIFGSTVDHPNSYALVSCVVAPGFDFKDFELMDMELLLNQYPDAEEIIRKLT
ncbi:cupin domain-containing protein [Algoriphagus sp. NF]|uniref:cupin domain-containing protein n=1 Tax=Algoriphagus sp. NF TaxID=2992756 RepID=UPI00237BE7B2|nr:cupin domain-containing protein [Algoriphagus sp. NF]MDE0559183.1 cupin domain-containing protein [Algoriphagus sp. NF]